MSNTHRLLSAVNPQSVAVLGASDREGSRGSFIWRGVMNSRRVLEAYPVNPKYKYIGLTPCWAKLADLPQPPDLAVIATSSRRVESLLNDCAKAGIKNVLVTPGEGEFTENRLWREKLADIARKSKIRLVGVDSTGLIRPKSGLNVSYWPRLPLSGHIGLIAQTTTTAAALLDYAEKYRFGFSSVVSVGAETDVALDEVIDCLVEDEDTQVIAVDVLALRRPRAFFSAVRAASRIKPVLILYGPDAEGISALTAARLNAPVAEPDNFRAAVKKAGAVATDSLSDFCGALRLLADGRLPRGPRAAVLGNGVGAAAAGSGALTQTGLALAHLSVPAHEDLQRLSGSPAAAVDPTDAGAEAPAERLAACARRVLAETDVDALIVALAPTAAAANHSLPTALADAAETAGKPVIAVRLGAPDINFENTAADAGLPIATTPAAAARMLALACRAAESVFTQPTLSAPGSAAGTWDMDAARSVIEDAQRSCRFVLAENDLAQILRAYGIPFAAGITAATPEEAVTAAERIGMPVALKVSADGIAHKTDARGVLLNVKDAAAVRAGFESLRASVAQFAPHARFRGVWVQTMTVRPAGRELTLAVETDPVLGPVIRLGVGGMAASLFKGHVTLIPPVTEAEAREALKTFEARAWFGAFRGMPAANIESLIRTLLKLSAVAETLPAVTRLALTPLVLDDEGAVTLDAEGTVNAGPAAGDDRTSHLTFAGSPRRLHQPVRLTNGFVMIRSIHCDDAEVVRTFAKTLPEETCRAFFGKAAAELTARDLSDITSPDFDRDVLFLAIDDSHVAPAVHALVHLTRINARETRFAAVYEPRWEDDALKSALNHAVRTVCERLAMPIPLN